MSVQQTSETTPPPSAGDAARPRPANLALTLGLAASVLLGAFACRELLHFQPKTRLVVSLTGHVEEWFFEPSDSSPLVVLVLCGWLLWRRRRRLAALWGRSGPVSATALLWLAATAIFVWAVRAGAPDLQALALVPMLLGAGNLLGGPAALRVLALPAATLLFAMPLPAPLLSQVLWWLQIHTAEFTGLVLHLIGYSSLVSGDRILTNNAVFAIIETCSGVRSIETLGMLTILMVDLFERRGAHAVLLLMAAPPVAFLINGLRCVGLIFNPHADIASIHTLQGIVMLLGGVVALYLLDGLLARFLPPGPRLSAIERRVRADAAPRSPLAPRVFVLVGLSLVWLGLSWLPRFSFVAPSPPLPADAIAEELGGWKDVEALATEWLFLGQADFRATIHRHYTRGYASVDLFLGQADGEERLRSYLSPKIAFPGSGWAVEDEQLVRIAGRDATLRQLRRGSTRLLVAHWFEDSPGVAAETARALLALDTSPLVRSRLPVAVRLSTPLLPGSESRARALDRIERFAELLSPGLSQMTGASAPSQPAG